MFELPQDSESTPDGLTDSQPIRLEDVKRKDFKQLLRVMYAQYVRPQTNRPWSLKPRPPRSFSSEEISLTESDWTSVLVLAARWEMLRLQDLAIDNLTPLFASDPHKLVDMGRKYNIDFWIMTGIQSLVMRKDPMNEDDANIIGPFASLKISAIREWTLHWKIAHRDSTEWILNRRELPPLGDILKKIRDVFELPAVD